MVCYSSLVIKYLNISKYGMLKGKLRKWTLTRLKFSLRFVRMRENMRMMGGNGELRLLCMKLMRRLNK
jgi:cell fate regulator YaaT (PSP1 superfamily)